MRGAIRVLALTAIGAVAFTPSAHAQDMTTYTFGGTTLYIGGGFQYLSLPDIKFTGRDDIGSVIAGNSFRRQKNSDFSEYGGSAGGGFETALGYWNGLRVTGGVKGFFSSLENSDRKNCQFDASDFCIIVDPTGEELLVTTSFITKTDRDVDYWGGSAELKFGRAEPVHAKPNLYRNDYFIVGADIRGIDQDNRLRNQFAGGPEIFDYKETLDTTYTGGYVGVGGEYSFGFLGMGGFYDRIGLRTFINARAGLYNAETDYDGRFAFLVFPVATKLSESSDDLAFIGTISLETRKQFGPRTSLSLWTDYEYISSVPELKYATFGGTTRIVDDSSFATRTMLRLNIGLGSQQLYEEPLK